MTVKFRPLDSRLLVRAIEKPRKTIAGIIIPDNATGDKPQEGLILAVGNGKRSKNGEREPLSVKVGQKILYGQWSGHEVKIDGEELLIIEEKDIMGVIKENA